MCVKIAGTPKKRDVHQYVVQQHKTAYKENRQTKDVVLIGLTNRCNPMLDQQKAIVNYYLGSCNIP